MMVKPNSRWLIWLGLILTLGMLIVTALAFISVGNTARSAIIDRDLPLTSDLVFSEVQNQLARTVSISAEMAGNTFLHTWAKAPVEDAEKIVPYLRNVQRRSETDTAFFVSERSRKYYDINGILRIVNPKKKGDAWYFRTRKMREPYELNAYSDEINRDKITVFINYRTLDAQGQFLGMTGVGVTLDTLNDLIGSLEQRFARHVSFVNEKGEIMLEHDQRSELRGSIQAEAGLSDVVSQLLNKSVPSVQTSYRKAGAVVQVYSRFVPELKWFLLVEQDEATLIEPLTRLPLIGLILAGLTFLVMFWVAITSRFGLRKPAL
jgi:hypothetical protein